MQESELTKPELEKLLLSLEIPVAEGTPKDTEIEAPVRICFWEFRWEPLTASGTEYNTKVLYQVSLIGEKSREPKLIKLKNKLKTIGLNPVIEHEYVIEDRRWHSYFSIEILEKIGD